MGGLVSELRRRNVFRVAAAYVVIGWLLLQVADIVLGFIDAPNWVGQALIALLLLGFVPVMALAWVFEVGPHGIHVDNGAIARDAGPQARRLDVITLIAVMFVVLLLFWQHLGPALTGEQDEAETLSAGKSPAIAGGSGPAGGSDALSQPVAIAVLPFVNMSGDAGNEYFADGISEEILNLLAQIRSLRVAGRTSAFKFKGHNEDLRLIGEQLGVSHILEGSVRKSGERVRITAQLVQVDDGFHLWSDTYDRELTDIFAVQDEIGRAIVAALRGRLLEESPEPHIASTGMDAYTRYLRAQTLLAARGAENLHAAREQFEAALALDPDYVPALTGLAQTLALLPSYSRAAGESPSALAEVAAETARRALSLDPDNAQAHSVLGTVYTFYLWRWREAEQAFERALGLAPNDAEIVNFAGDYYRATLERERALALERRAVDLDPLHAVNRWDLGYTHLALGDCDSALDAAEAARAMAPERIDPYLILNWCLGRLRRFEDMNRVTAEARRHTRESAGMYEVLEFRAAFAEGRRDYALASQSRLRELVEAGEHQAANLGFQYVLLGESEQAARWLQHAYDQRDSDLVFPESIDLWRIDADPKARAVLQQPGLKELLEIRTRNARAAGEQR